MAPAAPTPLFSAPPSPHTPPPDGAARHASEGPQRTPPFPPDPSQTTHTHPAAKAFLDLPRDAQGSEGIASRDAHWPVDRGNPPRPPQADPGSDCASRAGMDDPAAMQGLSPHQVPVPRPVARVNVPSPREVPSEADSQFEPNPGPLPPHSTTPSASIEGGGSHPPRAMPQVPSARVDPSPSSQAIPGRNDPDREGHPTQARMRAGQAHPEQGIG